MRGHQAGIPVGPPTDNQSSLSRRSECWSAACRGNCPAWTLPEIMYLSRDGFGGERSEVQRRSPGTQVNVNPRQLRKRPMTRPSVKSSTRSRCSGWLVRLRNGAMATAMLGSSHGHCGCDFRGFRDRWATCLGALASSGICNVSTIMSCAHLILVKASKSRQIRTVPSMAFSSVQHGPERWRELLLICLCCSC